jgi:hypothetical protein
LSVALLLGCSSGSGPTLAEMRACTTDADCITVLSVCCPCIEVESLTGINGRYYEQYRAHLGCAPRHVGCDACLGPGDRVERQSSCVAGVCEGGPRGCVTADDCAPGGACTNSAFGSTFGASYCFPECSVDTECRAGEVCAGSCVTS